MTARTPFVENLLGVVVPSVARWLVGKMRRLEEANLSPIERWEMLRQSLEQMGKDR